MAWSKFVSMEMDDEDKMDAAIPEPVPMTPDFPWSLRIALTNREMKKLGLDGDLPEVGDYIDLRAFACVTSVTSHQADGEANTRVELQIERLAIESEDEDE